MSLFVIDGSCCGKRVIVKNIISLLKTDKGMSFVRSQTQAQTILETGNKVEVMPVPERGLKMKISNISLTHFQRHLRNEYA